MSHVTGVEVGELAVGGPGLSFIGLILILQNLSFKIFRIKKKYIFQSIQKHCL